MSDTLPRSLRKLRSIPHNLAHHFSSCPNYYSNDYAINHLWKATVASGRDRIRIDVLEQKFYPENIGKDIIPLIISSLKGVLVGLLNTVDFPLSRVKSMIIEYEFHSRRTSKYPGGPVYDAVATLTTTDGKVIAEKIDERHDA